MSTDRWVDTFGHLAAQPVQVMEPTPEGREPTTIEGPPPSSVPTREALYEALVTLEDEAVAIVLGALEPVMVQVTASLIEHQPIGALTITAAAVDDLTSILDAWGYAVDADVLPYYEEIYRLGGMSAVLQIVELGPTPGVMPDFERITQPYLAEATARHMALARDRFLHLGNEAWRDARVVMLDGIDHGRSIDEISRNLRGVVDISKAQATLLARTEVVAAANAGALAQAQMAGPDAPLFKQWLATNDERTRPSHWEADGQTTQLNDVFLVGGSMLEYPGDPKGPSEEVLNCRCVGGLAQVSARGVRAITRRWHDGPMIALTTRFGELLVTPEHPVATPVGWKAAGLLHEGDHVLGVPEADTSGGLVADVDEVVARIEDVWRTLDLSALAHRVSGPQVDFYGDVPDGEVEVAATDLDLPLRRMPEVGEHGGQLGFSGPHRQMGAPGGSADETVVTHPQDVGIAAATRLDPGVKEDATDSAPAEVVTSGQRLLALTTGVRRDDLLRHVRPALATRGPDAVGTWTRRDARLGEPSAEPAAAAPDGGRGFLHRQAVEIQLDGVRRIDSFRGHVYDLSTADGTFAGCSILLHNCSILFTDTPGGEDVKGAEGRGQGGVLADVAEGEEPLAAERIGTFFPGDMTVNKAEQWMRREWGDFGRGRLRAIPYQGLSRATANELSASMDRLLRKYPHVAERIRGFGASGELTALVNQVGPYRISRIARNSYADAFREAGIIRVAPKVSKAEFTERITNDVKTGFHPPGTDSIDGIVTHEFGHHLYWSAIDHGGQVVSDDVRDAVERAMLRFYRAGGLPDMEIGEIVRDRGTPLYQLTFLEVIRRDVSKYAAKSYDELMASAFASVEHSPNPSQLSRDLVDIMVRYSAQGTEFAKAG